MTEERSYVQHPYHPIPDEVAEGLRRFNEQERETAAHEFELAKLARPTDEERKLKAGLYETVGRSLGVDIEEHRTQSPALRKRRFEQIDRIQSQNPPALHTHGKRGRIDFEPPAPERSDPNFWWARTEWWASAPFTVQGKDDGVHIRGLKWSDSGSLQKYSYGLRAWYELQADRIPPSGGKLRSAPPAELHGELLAETHGYDPFTGDSWSKCWLHRRHTLFQWVFGPNGPHQAIIGARRGVQTVFFLENTYRFEAFPLPGFHEFDPIVLTRGDIFPGISIWADLEIRFDIQLEGDAMHSTPALGLGDVLVRLTQWPLEPGA